MNYEESVGYIHSLGMHSGTPGLDRIRKLLDALGNPQRDLRFVHIAGTNGKGSTSAMLDSILRAAGYRTGLYTSPFIRVFNERIRWDGENIPDGDLAGIATEVRTVAETLGEKFTEFELITAIGFVYFQRKGTDVVVLEVGLGGRLDPTNIIENPLLSVITGIDFDHTALLGNTIQKIAAEKAGIVKNGCPCLYGGNEQSACRTIAAIASARKSPFYKIDRKRFTVREMTLDGTLIDFGDLCGLKVSLLGTYQIFNIETVLTAVELLVKNGLTIPEAAIREGLATAKWPARFEKILSEPTVIYDGAHNPQGIIEAVNSIRTYFPDQKVNILSGVMTDKDYDEMVERLKPVTAHAYTVTPNNPRAFDAREYAATFTARKIHADAYDSIRRGVYAALNASREQGVPLICLGSLYLYREMTDEIRLAAEKIGLH